MAKNLQSKLSSSDTLRVFDINSDSVKRFTDETSSLGTGASVKAASSARDAAEDSVRGTIPQLFPSILTYIFM
jgi:3-hydroxyisobutyrate dehydrogenase